MDQKHRRKHPLLSVITVNLENVEGLASTLESISRQSSTASLESIVVDGGSSDGSLALLAASDVPDRLVIGQDKGIYDAMNIGLSLASGQFVTFLNSGDEFAGTDVVALLQRTIQEHPRVDWFYGRAARRPGGFGTSDAWSYAFEPFDVRRLALGMDTVPHQATFFRTAFARALGGFDTTAGLAADQGLLLKAALRSHPLVFDEVVAYLQPGGRGSSRRISEHVGDMRRFRSASGLAVYGTAGDMAHDWAFVAYVMSRVVLGRARRGLRRIIAGTRQDHG